MRYAVHMIRALPLIVSLFAGAALGIASADWAVRSGVSFDQVAIGPWTTRSRTGVIDDDPYARAMLARSGEIAMGPGEGLFLLASVDSDGRALSGDCVYIVSGDVPQARHWSLAAFDVRGQLIETPLRRYAFTSAEPARDAQGRIAIRVAALAQAGDWLPVAAGRPFRLALRLYDTPVGATAAALSSGQAPSIRREGCA